MGVIRLTAAYTVLATLPGVPSVFYGDEAGLQGYGDPFNRLPMPWHRLDKDLLAHYRHVGMMRRKEHVYAQGEFSLLRLDADALAFVRFEDGVCCVTVLNQGSAPMTMIGSRPMTVLIGDGAERRRKTVTVPIGTAAVIKMTEDDLLSLDGVCCIRVPDDFPLLHTKSGATE